MHYLLELDQKLTLLLNGSQSLYVDALATTVSQTVTWLPLALVLLYLIIRNNDWAGIIGTVIAIALCITIADQVASSVFKPLVGRFRPAQDPLIMYTVDVVNGYRGGRFGFFSSHAANTMAVATFVALAVKDRALAFWLYSWVLLNCWSRIYLGVHYCGDILVGLVWGALVGWGLYRLWFAFCPGIKERCLRNASRSGFTRGGYGVSTVHILILGFAFTYLFVIIAALFRSAA